MPFQPFSRAVHARPRMRALVSAVALAAVLAVAGCGPEEPSPKASAPIPVSVYVVDGPEQDRATWSFAGTVRRDREASLSFRVGGTLVAMPARTGQKLAAGALVAGIDPTPYRASADRQAAEVARLERAVARYAKLTKAGAVAEAQAKDAASALTAARAGLATARFELAGAQLVMPFAGVVLSRQAERGETVAPGQPVATVADLDAPLLATAQVTAALAGRLRPGMVARVEAAGQTGMAAQVLRVAGGSDPRAGTVAVDVVLPAAARLVSGTPVAVRFTLSTVSSGGTAFSSATMIPAEALVSAQGNRAAVFVIDAKGRARRRDVRFEGFADQSARVSGLPAGTRVITAGAGFVAEGDAVVVAGT